MRKINYKLVSLFIFIVALTVMAQYISIPLIFGVTLSFAPILYLASIRLFGVRFALLLVSVMSGITYFTGMDNGFVFYSIIEVLLIGSLYVTKRKDLFTWSFAYSLLIFLVYSLIVLFFSDLLPHSRVLTDFLVVQSVTEILFAALVADIICDYLPLIPKLKRYFGHQHRLYFGQVISHLLIFSAVLPLLIIILVNTKQMESDLYQLYQEEHQQLSEQIQYKIDEMDSGEIQSYQLDAVTEKARIKEVFDQFIGQSNKRIFILDQNNQLWVDANQLTVDTNIEYFTTGFVKEIHNDGFIWLPVRTPSIFDWSQGYYIGEMKFLNKSTFLVIPTNGKVLELTRDLIDYLLFALFVLFVALFFGMLVNRILSNSLTRLTQMTSDLPEKMQRQDNFYWRDTSIFEFSKLGLNIEKVANRLQSMFIEVRKKNDLLTARTDQLMESEAKLYQLAHFDTLTDLPNRHSFHTDLTECLDREVREERFAIIFIDLDKFKQVNDTLGHSGGDLLLQVFAKRLIEFQQTMPVIFYRLAGDEFVGIVELSRNEEVNQLCDELLTIIQQPLLVNRKEILLSASIGLSFYPDHGNTIDQLLHHADTLMYEEKKLHHNTLKTAKEADN
ncbi:diguanylate cyclase domain-containing protein [Gracilibacillus salinarum]|uniref:Diguanylate cyclase n=1 Tax=Gracilibacillus salinarum TaxID=2932255 RepID=A0ABY4GPR3_9BACI|nr:diguanylate cyclase [Gracilibacillus salinarum]UOQ86378.1 diguanylate cyclase [Gracilibacillus salinarum]